MGKPARLALALFLLSALLLAGAWPVLSMAARDVTYTETVLAGDRQAAAGLVVEQKLSSTPAEDSYALWEISCALGPFPEASARLSLAAQPQDFGLDSWGATDPSGHYWSGPLRLTSQFSDSSIRTDAQQPSGLSLAVREAAQELFNGGSKQIRLANYYDYYPVSGTLLMDGQEIRWDGDPVFADDWSALTQALSGHIRIPIQENHEVGLSRSSYSANRYDFTVGHSMDPERSGYAFNARSALGEGAIYFTIGSRAHNRELVDTSHIPGGYGIYRLPYTRDGAGGLQWGPVSTVYPLEEENEVIALHVAEGGRRLLLVTEEEDGLALTVLDTASWRTVQTLPLPDPQTDPQDRRKEYVVHREALFFGDGYLVYALDATRLAVYAPGEDGLWGERLVTPSLAEAAPEVDAVPYIRYYTSRRDAAAWDGERLAVVTENYLLPGEHSAYEEFAYEYSTGCGFQLAVYDGSGLRYLGRYDSSLDPGWSGPTPHGTPPLRIRFN